MTAVQSVRERAAVKVAYLALLFAAAWAACFLLALGPGHEQFGALAMAGALGSAVFPWCVGAAIVFVSGRNGRPVALAVCLIAVAALWIAPRL
ncbi:MAG TPA: hypothetical protein VG407_02650 [Caulobacteraceae bacterium]|jgi:hypothetical protein|nr:hypothetical protein [Caulobacteraceae bacterium]